MFIYIYGWCKTSAFGIDQIWTELERYRFIEEPSRRWFHLDKFAEPESSKEVLPQLPQMNRLSQLDSSQSLREMRYTTKAMYAAVPVETRDPINKPLTSERKKWSKRYPLITITSPATVHAALYSATAVY